MRLAANGFALVRGTAASGAAQSLTYSKGVAHMLMIETLASHKSFRRKDRPTPPPSDDPGNPPVNFHGEKRSNETHESKLAYCGNVMVENRNRLVVDAELLQCNGTAERDAALLTAELYDGTNQITVEAETDGRGIRVK